MRRHRLHRRDLGSGRRRLADSRGGASSSQRRKVIATFAAAAAPRRAGMISTRAAALVRDQGAHQPLRVAARRGEGGEVDGARVEIELAALCVLADPVEWRYDSVPCSGHPLREREAVETAAGTLATASASGSRRSGRRRGRRRAQRRRRPPSAVRVVRLREARAAPDQAARTPPHCRGATAAHLHQPLDAVALSSSATRFTVRSRSRLAELDHRLTRGQLGGVLDDRVAGAQRAVVFEEAVGRREGGGVGDRDGHRTGRP